MATAPYYYHGDKKFAEMVYPELQACTTYAEYDQVKTKYKMAFLNSRPYRSTVTNKGASRFPAEWNRTLKNLKEMYGYTPPTKSAKVWEELLRENGH